MLIFQAMPGVHKEPSPTANDGGEPRTFADPKPATRSWPSLRLSPTDFPHRIWRGRGGQQARIERVNASPAPEPVLAYPLAPASTPVAFDPGVLILVQLCFTSCHSGAFVASSCLRFGWASLLLSATDIRHIEPDLHTYAT